MNKYFIRIYIIIGCLAAFSQAFAQNLSNRGNDFWVGYGHHQFMETGQSNAQEMVLYFSAEQAANVTVTIEGTTYVRNYFVPANSVIASQFLPKSGPTDARLISLPCSFVPPGFPCGGEGVFAGKAIHIVSDVPIVAYAHIWGSASSGASMLMPVETWGYSYTTLNSNQSYQANCFSWVYVIAQQDNTLVEVTPSATTRTGKPANTPYTISLNRGEIYQVMAGPEAATAKGEMTGTKIKSLDNGSGNCYPIAVFAGSSRTSNTAACGSGGGDNDNQQCFPTQAWGKRYLTAPTSNSSTPSNPMTNGYKIAVKEPGTIVKRNGTVLTPLPNGTYYFQSSTADYIEADKPIMVAQFMTGGGCLGNPSAGGDLGDPEMMYISPIEQGIKRIGFYRNTDQAITVNYLTLIIPTAGVASLLIDGSATFSHSYPHPQLPGYTVVIKRWSGAKSQAVAQSDSAFTAITYGLGSVESYGYNAGTLINNLSAVGEIQNTLDPSQPSHPFTCTNTPMKLSILTAYQPTKMVWRLSLLAGNLTPATDVVDNAPTSVGTSIINGVTYYKYTLPGIYKFSAVGTFQVFVDCTNPSIENCNNTETLKFLVEVRGKPWTDFSISHTGCKLDSAHFAGPSVSSNGYNINKWNWIFPGNPATSTLQNPAALISALGVQNVALEIISTEGCVGDTIKKLTVVDKPIANFNTTPAAVCEGGSISFSDISGYTGSAPINSWYWDFGNGNVSNAPNANPVSSTYPGYGIYTVKHVVGVSNTCPSDTITKTVTIRATPRPSFSYPAGCLPANGIVQFTGTTIVPDGQAISGYTWDFGDPNANAGNPNTSTSMSPTHFYSAFGNYTITYSATTVNGCTKDTVVNATFNLRPVLAYPALAPICQNQTGTVSVATASITNGVPGTGVYVGPATDAAGNFNPSVAGYGTHTIWYKYTTTAGCTDSISRTILVRARAVPKFSFPAGGCLPVTGLVQFTNNTTVADGQTMAYQWNFNDPNANAGNPNTSAATSPSHIFLEGTYNIQLTITTGGGCISDTTITATFSRKPSLAYPALTGRCQNETTPVSIATATVTNGVTGIGVYRGPGTDAAGNFTPSVAGFGTHTIWYKFTTTGGCVDSISRTIAVRAKPTAKFTYTNPTCLPTTGLVTFTNNSTIADAQTMSWAWNFDDPNANAGNPNTSTAQHPTHNFLEGTFDIHLTATTNTGCIGDTTITATFSVKPALAFPALTSHCQNETTPVSIATATVTNGVTGTGVYRGPGTDAAGNFTPSVAGFGTHTIWYKFTTTGGCVDSISRTIAVRAKPTAKFTYTNPACLPTTGLVTFTNNSTIADAQIMTWAWNFDDPNANAGNPNTSTAQHPTHNFLEGTFDIHLTATTNTGCIGDTTITATFSVKPALAFPALTSRCQNETTPVSIATATVTNGVTGTGVYRGPGTDAAGNFTPSVAGFGTHTIWYKFTTTGGCVDSISRTIAVRAKPTAKFTYTNPTCLPTTGLVTFTNNSTIADAQTMTWAWNFDDPNANAGNPNTSTAQHPTHNFLEGTFDIHLTATTNTGCIGDTTITATFSVKPALAFPALTNHCESDAAFSIATATVTNGVTGTGVYRGPGTDAAGTFTPAVAGFGTHTIWYKFTTTGGCTDSISRTIQVHPKPLSAFTVNSNTCLNAPAIITNQSTIPSGSISSWNWDFGDGNSITYTNGNSFTRPYAAFGNYTIKLVTVSDNGCISDTVRHDIGVHALPLADFDMPASVCMPNGIVAFNNLSKAPDNASLIYRWDFGDATATSSAVNPTHVYAASQSYNITLRATSNFGCFKDTTKIFNAFYDKPIANFEVTPDNLCQGTMNEFRDLSSAPNSSIQNWNWDFGDGNFSAEQIPSKMYAQPGNYTIILTVKNAVGCTSDPYSKRVIVNLQPKVDAGPSFVVPLNTILHFSPIVNDSSVVRFLWSPASDFSNPTLLRPVMPATHNQTYTLTATGPGNCAASDTMFVKILKPIIVPNAFSPNGDGTNDQWVINDLADYPGVTVDVYNRYGQLIYTSSGYTKPWDGTIKGKPLPFATYYYIINLKNGFEPLSGSVTIIK